MPDLPPDAVPNHAKSKLAAGELVLCMGVRLARTAEIARLAKACGFDALFVDMEHSTITTDTASEICTAALDAGVTPLVRVPGHAHHHATRVLDGGAMGIIVPHVNTRAEAERAVANCRFPPVGHRSVAGLMPQLGYQPTPAAEAMRILNDTMLLTVMLETPEAIDNAEAIAAVDGIDQIMIGTNDLCATMGIPGQLGHDRIIAAYRATASACKANGKYLAIGGIGIRNDAELLQKLVDMGARFILGGADSMTLLAAFRSDVKDLRRLRLD